MRVKALYSLAEVARLLGRPKSTVQWWAKTGRLTTVLWCGKLQVPLAALQAQGLVWDSIKLAARLNAARA